MERLNKYLAEAGIASRRESDRMIEAGRVSVNGRVVRELGMKVDPAGDRVEVDGRPVFAKPTFQYLILNKPPGYLTTAKDPFGRPTVMDLLPRPSTRLYPVGRLDLDTSGLLFFTNDGEMALALAHPRHLVEKVYLATVRGIPTGAELDRLAHGVCLDDGWTAPAQVAIERIESGHAIVEITLREGRKRQVKRMFEAVGHPVVALHRIKVGPLALGDLPPGQTRKLTETELAQLKTIKEQSRAENDAKPSRSGE